MSSVQFCFWLQGFFELANPREMTPAQVEMVKKHLSLVFIHEIDPSFPVEQQEQLNNVHTGDLFVLPATKPSKPVSNPHGESPAGEDTLFSPTLYRC